jgi:pyruvate/2-oxoglutarate/acetoin dehydrogenase E1 component
VSVATETEFVKITSAEAARMAIEEAMAEDPTVLVLGEDVADPEGGGIRKVTKGLSTRFGEDRVKSTPISEQAIMGAAVGAAIAGMRPVAEIMLMNFLAVAMDQLVNHAAKIRYMSGGATSVPLTVRTMTGAGRSLGGQHSDMVEAWLAHTPGLKVVVPSTPADYKGLLYSCIFDDDPCIFVENGIHLSARGDVPVGKHIIPLGKAHIVQPGKDVTLVSYGRPMDDARKVAEKLAGEGISVELIDLRSIVPLDEETILNSVGKTKRLVVLHEAVRSFGVGAEIAARVHEHLFNELAAPVQRLGMPDVPVPFSAALEKHILWSPEKIEAAIKKTLG